MRYLSVCSGIEAATVAWRPLGWQAVGFSEIEPFPCAVLAHHYPDTPNLGDMTRYDEWTLGAVDLVVGGTPCQSFSIAGLRGGMADARGNLTLTFLKVVEHTKPRYVVWENVPGIVSDSTRALHSFLDGLEEIGYAIIGIDILDAQWFGLAQRRRRIFVCAQNIDDLLRQKTRFSGLMAAQCLAEIWHNSLGALSAPSSPGAASSVSASSQFVRSLQKRIALFGLRKEGQALKLLDCLAALLPSSECEPCGLDSGSGKASNPTPESIADTECGTSENLAASTSESPSTAPSWRIILEGGLRIANECITLISTNETTDLRICTCAQAMLTTVAFMRASHASLPGFSTAGASCLMALEGYINYARQAANSLFTGMARVRWWRDFLGQAIPVYESLGGIGVRNFGEILPLRESLRGDSAPSREAGTDVARRLARGACGSHGRYDPNGETYVTHSLRADGFDASEDGTGRGTPLVFDTTQVTSKGNYSSPKPGDPCHPLASGAHAPAIAFAERGTNISVDGDCAATMKRNGDNTGGRLCVAYTMFGGGKRQDRPDGGLYVTADDTMKTLESSGLDPTLLQGGAVVLQSLQPNGMIHPTKEVHHADAVETDSVKALRVLREAVGEEALSQWGLGVLAAFWPKEVLQSEVHGASVRCTSQPKRGLVNVALSRSQVGSSWTMRDLWEAGCDGCPPQGWKPSEQLARELGAYLSQLPHAPSPAEKFLHDLWEASEGARLLRQALSAVQDARRSITRQTQSTQPDYQVRRLTVEEAEALQGFPRGYTLIPHRGKPAADRPRYRALGNSMAVPVMRWLGERIGKIAKAGA